MSEMTINEEQLTRVLYDWMPDGADVADEAGDVGGGHFTGSDLARFIFDRARESALAPLPEWWRHGTSPEDMEP